MGRLDSKDEEVGEDEVADRRESRSCSAAVEAVTSASNDGSD